MPTIQTHWPITNAMVTRIRACPAYTTPVSTGPGAYRALTGLFEGFAPEKASYPFATWNLAVGAYDYLFGSDTTLIAMVDVFVFSRESVEAENLDRALAAWLSDQPLTVSGQTTLLCRRMATVPTAPDFDNEGEKVYQKGGTYHIETDAPPLP